MSAEVFSLEGGLAKGLTIVAILIVVLVVITDSELDFKTVFLCLLTFGFLLFLGFIFLGACTPKPNLNGAQYSKTNKTRGSPDVATLNKSSKSPEDQLFSKAKRNIKSYSLSLAEEQLLKLESDYPYFDKMEEVAVLLIFISFERDENLIIDSLIDRFFALYPRSKYRDYLNYIRFETSFSRIRDYKRNNSMIKKTIADFSNIEEDSKYYKFAKPKYKKAIKMLSKNVFYEAYHHHNQGNCISAVARYNDITEENSNIEEVIKIAQKNRNKCLQDLLIVSTTNSKQSI